MICCRRYFLRDYVALGKSRVSEDQAPATEDSGQKANSPANRGVFRRYALIVVACITMPGLVGLGLVIVSACGSSPSRSTADVRSTDPATLLSGAECLISQVPPGKVRHLVVHVQTLYVDPANSPKDALSFFGNDWEGWLEQGGDGLRVRYETVMHGKPVIHIYSDDHSWDYEGDLKS